MNNYICLTCNSQFVNRKKDKKYCSHRCYTSRHGTVTKVCETCNKDFTIAYRFRNQKACGMECAKSVIAKTLTTKGELFCVTCSKSFYQTQYNIKHGAKYCSKFCESKDHREEVACKTCGKITSCIKSQNKQFCNRKCANTGEFNAQYGKTGPLSTLYGKPAWSKGLKASTDPRLKIIGEKISVIISNKIINGEWTHINKGFINGWHDSLKSGKQYYRSSYEKLYFELLDKDDQVLSYKSEPFFIPYEYDGSIKNYTPDVLVLRKTVKQLVEIKPSTLVDTKMNIAKATAAINWCKENNVEYLSITEKNLILPKTL